MKHARYDDAAALARVAKRYAPEGADMSDAQGESDIDMAIRLRQSPDWQAQEIALQSPPRWIELDALADARADGARQERLGSQKFMTRICALLAVSVILNFAQWVWKV